MEIKKVGGQMRRLKQTPVIQLIHPAHGWTMHLQRCYGVSR